MIACQQKNHFYKIILVNEFGQPLHIQALSKLKQKLCTEESYRKVIKKKLLNYSCVSIHLVTENIQHSINST